MLFIVLLCKIIDLLLAGLNGNWLKCKLFGHFFGYPFTSTRLPRGFGSHGFVPHSGQCRAESVSKAPQCGHCCRVFLLPSLVRGSLVTTPYLSMASSCQKVRGMHNNTASKTTPTKGFFRLSYMPLYFYVC